jgi:methionyl-tRNA formyltransferase
LILERLQPDWILNINCYQYLGTTILDKATKGVINFHNGPLPKYGGVNISSWPIINGERKHGVTWHLMNNKIDEGDILSQHFFDIGQNWTAAKLMSVCIIEGIKLFENHWEKWVTQQIKPQPQIGLRTYYSLKDLPPNLGYLNWNLSSTTLLQWIRGLSLFPYPNHFGHPKIKIEHSEYIVVSAQETTCNGTEPPGSILECNSKRLIIKCKENGIIINGLAKLDLSVQKIDEVLSNHQLNENSLLAVIELDK